MANLGVPRRYPFILNGVRFLVNPKHISVRKPLAMGALNTQAGVKYQVWYELPEIVTIGGQSTGETSFKELQFLKDNFARPNKVSDFYYKNRLYKCIIQEITVTSSSDYVFRYKYSMTLQFLHGQKFALEDLSLKKLNEDTLWEDIKTTAILIADDFRETLSSLGIDT